MTIFVLNISIKLAIIAIYRNIKQYYSISLSILLLYQLYIIIFIGFIICYLYNKWYFICKNKKENVNV